jgi:hypothetical protein
VARGEIGDPAKAYPSEPGALSVLDNVRIERWRAVGAAGGHRLRQVPHVDPFWCSVRPPLKPR